MYIPILTPYLRSSTGMNLNDFFIFMSRLSLGNMVLLHSYSEKQETLNPCSAAMTQNLLLNLSTIRKIMMTMISAGGVTAKEVYLDLRETLEDPRFHRLCGDMGRTYAMIHKEEEEKQIFISKELLQKIITGFAYQKMQICSPKDLVEMIDHHNTRSKDANMFTKKTLLI